MTMIQLTEVRGEPLADSRMLATYLGSQHRSVFRMVKDFQSDFEQLGVLRFEIAKPVSDQGGRPEKYALLNEDQCYLLLTFSRNTAKVRQLKVSLVLAFKHARNNAKRSTMANRLPLHHEVLDTSFDRRLSPSRVWGLINRYVGERHARNYSVRQVNEGLGFCGKMRRRTDTPEDWQRIEQNHIKLYGDTKQLSLWQLGHDDGQMKSASTAATVEALNSETH